MVKLTIDQVIRVVAMRNGLMAAVGAVLMTRGVRPAEARGAVRRVLAAHRQAVLVHVVLVRVVQMAVVQVIRVPLVKNRRVSAIRTMLVRMSFVRLVRHACPPS
jgi:hypothetical protein